MAKLYYRYSAMNAGKSTLAMQVAHNYEEKGGKIVVFKPLIDTKGNKTIVSRIGISRTVDHLLSKEESPIKRASQSLPITTYVYDPTLIGLLSPSLYFASLFVLLAVETVTYSLPLALPSSIVTGPSKYVSLS